MTTPRHVAPDEPSAWPFESQDQWHRYEPLLASLELPRWEDSPHFRRPLPRWLLAASSAVATALLFVAVYLLTAILWPISLLANSFAHDVIPRHDDAAAPAR